MRSLAEIDDEAFQDDEDFAIDGFEGEGSVDTGAATKGSEGPLDGIGMNQMAAHSTVIIKVRRTPSVGKYTADGSL